LRFWWGVPPAVAGEHSIETIAGRHPCSMTMRSRRHCERAHSLHTLHSLDLKLLQVPVLETPTEKLAFNSVNWSHGSHEKCKPDLLDRTGRAACDVSGNV
jgi:hypothetical protein